ncbi:hypothetical protein QEO77_gp49 [Arthrobacter phage Zaheer]|uniref:Uncharacterized protein n=1 Tax=Arthrobacter phage Zaheer TaxID=2836041 RepID=A0A8F3EB26_9CAUD|nr:hypothetical protein QEO77_gp49 [Arthrobacter phage Zaheer]QWY84254.1 hypothetical protein SEA_ZAHEER_58 [Arthrobacter phage Zaheer]
MSPIFAASGKPIPLPDTSPSDMGDMLVKTAWGYDLNQWNGFTDQQRAYCRENVTSAPYFAGVTR